jgi:hypothetical protein
MKKFLFAGDSFTWGEGLQFYSGQPDVFFPKTHKFDPNKISDLQFKFIYDNRFPQHVGNHFNIESIVRADNGGSNTTSISFIQNQININEFSHIIYQLTDVYREEFEFVHKGEYIKIYVDDILQNRYTNPKLKFKTSDKYLDRKKNYDSFFEYYETNFKSIEDFEIFFIKQSLGILKKELLKHIKKGILVYFLNWRTNYVPILLKDKFFSKRLITLNYLGNDYYDFETLCNNERPELSNQYVFNNFKVLGSDSHPSLLGHRIIAENVIKKIGKIEAEIDIDIKLNSELIKQEEIKLENEILILKSKLDTIRYSIIEQTEIEETKLISISIEMDPEIIALKSEKLKSELKQKLNDELELELTEIRKRLDLIRYDLYEQIAIEECNLAEIIKRNNTKKLI